MTRKMTYTESLRLKAERLEQEANTAWAAYFAAHEVDEEYRRAQAK